MFRLFLLNPGLLHKTGDKQGPMASNGKTEKLDVEKDESCQYTESLGHDFLANEITDQSKQKRG